MPQRFLRPTLKDSKKWNSLDWIAQSAYIRILNVVDDYGRYYGEPEILLGHLFSRRPDVDLQTIDNICKQLFSCKLVEFYEADSEIYLQVTNWLEKARSKSKFPEKTASCKQMFSIDNNCLPPSPSPSPSSSSSSNKKSSSKNSTYHKDSRTVLFFLNEESGRRYRENDTNLKIISQRLREPEVELEGVKTMIQRQVKKWQGTDMSDFLRPETLFRESKFDGYYAARNEPIINNDKKRSKKPDYSTKKF